MQVQLQYILSTGTQINNGSTDLTTARLYIEKIPNFQIGPINLSLFKNPRKKLNVCKHINTATENEVLIQPCSEFNFK